MLLSHLKQFLLNLIENISQIRYEIGFLDMPIESIIGGEPLKDVTFLKHSYRDRWFADPFILEANDNYIVLLVEEFFYSTQKGRIARLTIDKTSKKLLKNEVVLELDTHLSFPFIYHKEGATYICPESSATSSWIFYEYDSKSNTVLGKREIIHLPLTDAIMDQSGIIYSTLLPDPNSDSICLYASGEDGLYYEVDRIQFDEKIGRNAGAFFCSAGRLFRPAQESNHCYGHATVIQELLQENGTIVFRECNRFLSPHSLFHDGCHTMNVFDGTCVIDVNGPRFPYLKMFIDWVYQVYSKLFK